MSATSSGTTASAGAAPVAPAGLNDAFVLMYKLLAITACMVLVILFLTALFDLIMYQRGEIKQKLRIIMDKNVFNKDTTDTEAIQYIKNTPDDEPFNIFFEQKLIAGLFMIVGFAVLALGLQLGTFFGIKMWSVFKRAEFVDRIELPIQLLMVLVMAYVAASIMNAIYKRNFLKKAQPNIKQLQAQLARLNNYVYSYLTNDAKNTFLPALVGDDLDTVVGVLRNLLQRGSPDDMDLTAEDFAAIKMLFTTNLYGFYRYMIPEGDPAFDDIRTMFSSQGLRRRQIEPSMYLYYNQPTYVPNVYPVIRDRLQPLLGTREKAFNKELSRLMRELNRQLAALQDISAGKKVIRNYLLSVLLVVWIFVMILLGIFYKELEPYMGMVKAIFQGIWEKLLKYIMIVK